MAVPRVVLDTNVLVTGLMSRRGAAFKLLSLIGTGRFEISLSVPLVLEYEDALSRHLSATPLSGKDLEAFLDYLCSVGRRQEIFFLWRPHLVDPKDDLVLELAVAARAEVIVSYNKRDFAGAERFDLRVHDPKEFLDLLGETS